MGKSFEDILIDEFVRLNIKLHYPRSSRDRYASGLDGTYEKMKDEIRLIYLKEIINMNTEWDIQEMSKKASDKISAKTRVF